MPQCMKVLNLSTHPWLSSALLAKLLVTLRCIAIGCLVAGTSKPLVAQSLLADSVANLPKVQFAIDSELFVENETQSASRNLTLFDNGIVYDYSFLPNKTNTEIIIYDSNRKQTTLIDMQRKIRLELHAVQIIRMLDNSRIDAVADDRSRFLVEDDYEEVIDAEERTIDLTGANITYHVQGIVAVEEKMLPAYLDFLGAFTRLQATDPKKLPPFPRMRLNNSIRRVGWIPTRVDIKVAQNDLFKKSFQAHTTHKLINHLTDDHQKMIQDAKRYWMSYQPVDLTVYRNLKSDSKWKKLIRTAETNAKPTK